MLFWFIYISHELYFIEIKEKKNTVWKQSLNKFSVKFREKNTFRSEHHIKLSKKINLNSF